MNRQRLADHRRIVVKVGTTTLTYPNGRLNLKRMERLCMVLSDLCNLGKQILLVTSGAIAVGADRLRLGERPRDTRGKQAASAVGQALLMQTYQNLFSQYHRNVAQILLTRDIADNPLRKKNARNTFDTLLNMGVIPIVNENDAVATDEIESGVFNENDALSAYVAVLTESDLLIILSDIDGLYDADPKTNPSAKVYHEIEAVSPEIEALAGSSGSDFGTGGMATKLSSARMATANGIDTLIASGEDPAIIWKLLEGKQLGTFFVRKALRKGHTHA
ncbi:MAG: glutamate 5-kinase [Defluviitaleaceae bacterium]|nr:glutamate 5-kinase [Defluviitaleaceae bacterium]